jgi:hypothetical protein
VATLLAVTGAVLFFGLADTGAASALVTVVRNFHGYVSTLMWAYLVFHIGIALL